MLQLCAAVTPSGVDSIATHLTGQWRLWEMLARHQVTTQPSLHAGAAASLAALHCALHTLYGPTHMLGGRESLRLADSSRWLSVSCSSSEVTIAPK